MKHTTPTDRIHSENRALRRKVREQARTINVLRTERDRARADASSSMVDLDIATHRLDMVHDMLSERGMCADCKRALRAAAMVELCA